VHQVDDRLDAQLVDQVGDHFIGPAPVELGTQRLDAVPGHSPADGGHAQFAREREVLAPVVVVPHQLVLVERAVPGPGLRDEGVLDARRPDEVLRAPAQARPAGRQRPGAHRALSVAVRGKARTCSCWLARACSAAFFPATNA
jgi:hypothetical protein